MSGDRNLDILRKIIQYCDEIAVANSEYGCTLDALVASTTYKNAVAMCLLQIGEMATHLTEDFRDLYSAMPWQDIKGMRNIAAHRYGSFDLKILHKTVSERIPELRKYCENILWQHEISEQYATIEQEEDPQLTL
jgi:uncharacterized protein with HEPN domain